MWHSISVYAVIGVFAVSKGLTVYGLFSSRKSTRTQRTHARQEG